MTKQNLFFDNLKSLQEEKNETSGENETSREADTFLEEEILDCNPSSQEQEGSNLFFSSLYDPNFSVPTGNIFFDEEEDEKAIDFGVGKK